MVLESGTMAGDTRGSTARASKPGPKFLFFDSCVRHVLVQDERRAIQRLACVLSPWTLSIESLREPAPTFNAGWICCIPFSRGVDGRRARRDILGPEINLQEPRGRCFDLLGMLACIFVSETCLRSLHGRLPRTLVGTGRHCADKPRKRWSTSVSTTDYRRSTAMAYQNRQRPEEKAVSPTI